MKKTMKFFILISILGFGALFFSGCSFFENNKDLQTYYSYFSGHKKSLNNCCNECFGLRTLIYPDMTNYWESSCSEYKGLSGECKSFFEKYYPVDSYGTCISKSPDLEKSAKSSFLKGMKEKYGDKKWVGKLNGKCKWNDKLTKELQQKIPSPVKCTKDPDFTMAVQEMKIDFDTLEKQDDISGSNTVIPLLGSGIVTISPRYWEIGNRVGVIEEKPTNNPISFKFVGEIYQYGAADGLAFSFHPIDDYEGKLMIRSKATVYSPPPPVTLIDMIPNWLYDLNWFCPMTMHFTAQGNGLMDKIIINYNNGDNEEATGEFDLQ